MQVKLARGLVGAPHLSGDGRTVVWNENRDGNVDIFRYRDGVVDRISSDARQDIHPRTNYDGSVICWSRFSTLDPNDPEGNFDVVAWKDGQETVLASGRANEFDPVVSPDGSKIAWTSDVDGTDRNYKIQMMQGGQVEDLTPDQGAHMGPIFGGERMFWRTYGPGGWDLSMREKDGSQSRITQDEATEVRPVATADGKTLVFQTASTEGDDDLIRLQVDTGQREVLAGSKKVDECWPAMTPDGKVVAWTNFDRRAEVYCDTQICTQESGKTRHATWGLGLHSNVAISDDGKHLAYLWIHPLDINQREVRLIQP